MLLLEYRSIMVCKTSQAVTVYLYLRAFPRGLRVTSEVYSAHTETQWDLGTLGLAVLLPEPHIASL